MTDQNYNIHQEDSPEYSWMRYLPNYYSVGDEQIQNGLATSKRLCVFLSNFFEALSVMAKNTKKYKDKGKGKEDWTLDEMKITLGGCMAGQTLLLSWIQKLELFSVTIHNSVIDKFKKVISDYETVQKLSASQEKKESEKKNTLFSELEKSQTICLKLYEDLKSLDNTIYQEVDKSKSDKLSKKLKKDHKTTFEAFKKFELLREKTINFFEKYYGCNLSGRLSEIEGLERNRLIRLRDFARVIEHSSNTVDTPNHLHPDFKKFLRAINPNKDMYKCLLRWQSLPSLEPTPKSIVLPSDLPCLPHQFNSNDWRNTPFHTPPLSVRVVLAEGTDNSPIGWGRFLFHCYPICERQITRGIKSLKKFVAFLEGIAETVKSFVKTAQKIRDKDKQKGISWSIDTMKSYSELQESVVKLLMVWVRKLELYAALLIQRVINPLKVVINDLETQHKSLVQREKKVTANKNAIWADHEKINKQCLKVYKDLRDTDINITHEYDDVKKLKYQKKLEKDLIIAKKLFHKHEEHKVKLSSHIQSYYGSEMPRILNDMEALERFRLQKIQEALMKLERVVGSVEGGANEFGAKYHEIVSKLDPQHDLDTTMEKWISDGLVSLAETIALPTFLPCKSSQLCSDEWKFEPTKLDTIHIPMIGSIAPSSKDSNHRIRSSSKLVDFGKSLSRVITLKKHRSTVTSSLVTASPGPGTQSSRLKSIVTTPMAVVTTPAADTDNDDDDMPQNSLSPPVPTTPSMTNNTRISISEETQLEDIATEIALPTVPSNILNEPFSFSNINENLPNNEDEPDIEIIDGEDEGEQYLRQFAPELLEDIIEEPPPLHSQISDIKSLEDIKKDGDSTPGNDNCGIDINEEKQIDLSNPSFNQEQEQIDPPQSFKDILYQKSSNTQISSNSDLRVSIALPKIHIDDDNLNEAPPMLSEMSKKRDFCDDNTQFTIKKTSLLIELHSKQLENKKGE